MVSKLFIQPSSICIFLWYKIWCERNYIWGSTGFRSRSHIVLGLYEWLANLPFLCKGNFVCRWYNLICFGRWYYSSLRQCQSWLTKFGRLVQSQYAFLNPSKTNYMLLPPHKIDHSEHSIKIGSDIIEQNNYCKFLGLAIYHKLTWSEHIYGSPERTFCCLK